MLQNPLNAASLLWITDPWDTLDRGQDTTLRLGAEALNRGIPSYWSSPEHLLDAPPGNLKVALFDALGDVPIFEILPIAQFFQIHYRIDPPVDSRYRVLLDQMISHGVTPSQILNPMTLITSQSEKLPPPDLHDLAPKHRVIESEDDAKRAYLFLQDLNSWVSKPMNLAQSLGVKQWPKPKSEEALLTILRLETENFTRPLLVEEFLQGIQSGEVRLWFAMGEFIGTLKKYPLNGDFRVFIDQGSRIEAHSLSAEESEVARRVGASLKNQKIALAAVDLIDGKISDYNITSPGLLVQLERVHGGVNFASKIIDLLLKGF
jgi:glutathione synthase